MDAGGAAQGKDSGGTCPVFSLFPTSLLPPLSPIRGAMKRGHLQRSLGNVVVPCYTEQGEEWILEKANEGSTHPGEEAFRRSLLPIQSAPSSHCVSCSWTLGLEYPPLPLSAHAQQG